MNQRQLSLNLVGFRPRSRLQFAYPLSRGPMVALKHSPIQTHVLDGAPYGLRTHAQTPVGVTLLIFNIIAMETMADRHRYT